MAAMKRFRPLSCIALGAICITQFALPAEAIQATQSIKREMRHWQPSDELVVNEVSEAVFVAVHNTPVPSNSLVVFGRNGSCLMVDTPWTPEATITLMDWIAASMGSVPPTIAINTHFHMDRLGGNFALVKLGIPVYGSDKTVSLIKEKGTAYVQGRSTAPVVGPDHIFPLMQGITLDLDGEAVEVWFPGAGHTRDNVVVYLPQRKVLFGGCFVKSMAATDKGNIADADLTVWAASLAALKARYPDALVVIPGHGEAGGIELIDHTIELVK